MLRKALLTDSKAGLHAACIEQECEDHLVRGPHSTDRETEARKGETVHSFSASLCQGLHQNLGIECQDVADPNLLASHLEIIIDSGEVVNMVQKGPTCPSHGVPQWQYLQ